MSKKRRKKTAPPARKRRSPGAKKRAEERRKERLEQRIAHSRETHARAREAMKGI